MEFGDYCVNLGNQTVPNWCPAAALNIKALQLLREKIDQKYADQMVKQATIRPMPNKLAILHNGLAALKIRPNNAAFFKVCSDVWSGNRELMW